MSMDKVQVDVNFDFTSDTPNYWNHFWENKSGLGAGNADPDAESKTLQRYQKIIYSKLLPNGEKMDLEIGSDNYHYLTWKNFRFGSDSIIASFRYFRYKWMLDALERKLSDYKKYMEDYLHKAYTIGGEIIFPKRVWGINQSRGCNKRISDRFDLTLECIRRFYANEASPLSDCLGKDRLFFDLFINFEGYVHYFYLDDLVSSDYSKLFQSAILA